MANLREFISYLNEQVANHSIYIWGAQGQKWPTVTEAWIKSKESGANLTKALKTYRAAVAAGFKERLRAFDCSGLGMYYLQNMTGLVKSDMNANGMKGKCKIIPKGELKKGDWVFRTYKSGANKGRAYHIGYIVDDDLNVVEAKGRAYGVVRGAFSSAYWNTYGRPSYFALEIEAEQPPAAKFKRNLKKGAKGDDVRELQHLLNVAADANLVEDGDFGKKTLSAVKAYQKSMGLKVDGIAGKKTISALGGRWDK